VASFAALRSLSGLAFREPTIDTLFSKEHLLVGRPDRIVKQGGSVVPEEWKSSKKVQPGHIAQLGTRLILIEEAYGVRPAYGVIVLGDGVQKRLENTEELRKRVLDTARRIRKARRHLDSEVHRLLNN
jgi:CRISPR-associated exonuclease Cas4